MESMYKKYLEKAQSKSTQVYDLEQYAKTVLADNIKKYRGVCESIRQKPKLKNREERRQQAKHLISLAYMQTVGAIKDARRDALNEVIKAAEDAKKAMPKATPEQVAKYRDMVNDLKTDLLFTTKFEDKQKVIEKFMDDIDNPELAAELRREFGNISRDAFTSMQGDDHAKVTILFKKYYEQLKDGIDFYPEDVKETIKLARNAAATLEEDRIYNDVYRDTYVSQLLEPEQMAYIENTDEYFQEQYPELMEVNIGQKIDSTIERDILTPDTQETVREAVVSRLVR